MKYIITDNGGRYYRSEIDDWTVAREAATEYDNLREMPMAICNDELEYERYDDTVYYYPIGEDEAVASSQEVK